MSNAVFELKPPHASCNLWWSNKFKVTYDSLESGVIESYTAE